MPQKLLFKIGYYSVYENRTIKSVKYTADSGKTIYIERLKKYIINPSRDVKEFKTIEKLKEYVQNKLNKKQKEKEKKLSKIPKSLYLILIREESTNKVFVKVGITSKRFLMRRFSKSYGYEGYIVDTILRRVDLPDAEDVETEIKEKLKKKKSVKKYRPILESFSGYSECFDYNSIDEITKIFDETVNKFNK